MNVGKNVTCGQTENRLSGTFSEVSDSILIIFGLIKTKQTQPRLFCSWSCFTMKKTNKIFFLSAKFFNKLTNKQMTKTELVLSHDFSKYSSTYICCCCHCCCCRRCLCCCCWWCKWEKSRTSCFGEEKERKRMEDRRNDRECRKWKRMKDKVENER